MEYKFNNLSKSPYLEQVIKLDQNFFNEPWSNQSWEEAKSNSALYLSLFLEHNIVKAFSLYHFSNLENLAHLYKILVLPEFRSQGLASEMVKRDIENLQMLGSLESIFLEVSTSNTNAIALYEKLGFNRLTLKRSFYTNGHDAYAMQRLID